MRFAIPVVVFLFFQSLAYNAVIHVPGDYPTIQAGIDAASAGDTVQVAAGLYAPSTNGESFPIDIIGRTGITLLASGQVTIDSEGSVYDNLLYILNSDDIEVEGFTFQYSERKGIYCRSSGEVFVKGCLFLDCEEGALSSAWSTFYVLNNELKNTSARDANGLMGYETHTVAMGNLIHGFHTLQGWNVSGMGFFADDEPSLAMVANNIIFDNDCGVWGNDTEILIINNTIAGNLPLNPSDLKG
ncbi:MAG: NosD domain-containing protein, partial [Planctomycetota bacterium]